MFIKVKIDTDRDTSMDEALINTNQITWIDIEDKRIRFADASFLYVPSSELDKVLMATTEKVIIEDKQDFGDSIDEKELLKQLKVAPVIEQKECEKMLSNLDLSMSYVLESDHRNWTNQETANGWLFDKIIDWRKCIRPYIKEE